MSDVFRIKSITQFHEMLGLSAPDHPLISLIDEKNIKPDPALQDQLYDFKFSADMYAIMYKDKVSGSIGYGRNSYDFQEGTLIFSSPDQVFTTPKKGESHGHAGWTLLFHPDLLLRSNLGAKMDEYNYFSYESNEALHLSSKEESFISELIGQIRSEYSQNLDRHSQQLIISNLELLLNYCLRFYDRQFYTRTNLNKDFVSEFESCLKSYFKSDRVISEGIPNASYFGEKMGMSTNYLSDLLKKESGKSIKEHIDSHIVSKAKSILLNSNQSVSEIAYSLGFDYPQSFTRLFKKKTGVSPVQYRTVN